MVVLDDLMAETDGRVTQLFTKKSRHSNTSVIYLVQNLFPKHKESRTISLNAQYMLVFKNPRDASRVTHLAKQMHPGRVNFVQEAFKDATNVLSTRRSETRYARRFAPAHCHPTRRRRSVRLRSETITNTGTRHARHSASGDCVERTDMSRLVKRQVLCLQMLNRTHNAKLRKAILEYADAELISALCECPHNILRGTVRIRPCPHLFRSRTGL